MRLWVVVAVGALVSPMGCTIDFDAAFSEAPASSGGGRGRSGGGNPGGHGGDAGIGAAGGTDGGGLGGA